MHTRDKIIFLRLGAFGDLMVSLAALESIATAHANREIVVCGSALWLEILPRYPQFKVRKLYVIRKGYVLEEYTYNEGWIKSNGNLSYWRLCRSATHVYNLRLESLRYAIPAFFARVPIRVGSCPRFFNFFFTHWFGWIAFEPPLHERDWLLRLANAPARQSNHYSSLAYNRTLLKTYDFATQQKIPLPEYRLPAHSQTILRSHGLSAGKYILINPTASKRGKAWPAQSFKRLAEKLAKENVIIIGAPAESEWLGEVAGRLRIVQPQGLTELFCLVKHARALITNTSSMQFIASAARVPTLTLMGQAEPIRWGPLGENNLIIQGIKSSHGDLLERDREAYESISVEQVLSGARAWLTQIGNDRRSKLRRR